MRKRPGGLRRALRGCRYVAHMARSRSLPRRKALARLIILAASSAALALLPAAAQAKPTTAKVMTRNLYLGATLNPGLRATNAQELVNGAGVIFNEVDANDFRVRAKGLAAEIRQKNPHLVGLQEVALWRTGPCTESPIPPKAADVRYDFLKLLLAELNRGKRRYRTVVSEPEFDFEIQANTDGNESTSAPGCPLGSEINGRLTMRDVILAKRGGVKTTRARGGHFDTLLRVRPGGFPLDVTRGWTRVDAKVGRSRPFRFVNAHFEAFDNQASNGRNKGSDVGNGQVREAQAQELVGRGGPANAKLPVVAVGDFNSDVATPLKAGDELAFQSLLDAGFVERGATRPFSCCLDPSLLTVAGGGSVSDFDHNVDHIVTDTPKKIRRRSTSVTGRAPVNGFWDSDHAGVFSSLRVP